MSEVRAASGVPTTANFAGLGAPTLCAPVYVNTATGYIYALKTGDVVVAAGSAGTVTSVAATGANGIGVSGSPITGSGTLALSLAAITPTSVNALTLAAQAVGFTVAGGTTSKTLTVPLDATVSGTNTGDQTNITGNAATVTTNANLTGPITSTGNATAIASGNTYPTPTFTGAVTETPRAASYQWTAWNPTNLTGGATNAPATAAATLAATNYISMANSSGTVTFTFSKAGNYLINLGLSMYSAAAGPVVTTNLQITVGGSATRLVSQTNFQNVFSGDFTSHESASFVVTATANQTLTVLPNGALTASGGTTANYLFGAQASAAYMGTT